MIIAPQEQLSTSLKVVRGHAARIASAKSDQSMINQLDRLSHKTACYLAFIATRYRLGLTKTSGWASAINVTQQTANRRSQSKLGVKYQWIFGQTV